MITETMVTKALVTVGAWTIGTKVIAPVANWTGRQLGKGFGKVMNKLDGKGRKNSKEKVGDDQATEQAILNLLAECDQALTEENKTERPELTVVKESTPEPVFDQRMREWIQHCKDQYGGFANVVLE